MPSARAFRLDVGARIRDELKTVQGGARVPARLSRTGVQLYTQADGKVIREYRPAEEVFDAASLKSFETATVTIGHPDMVTPETWKRDAVGSVIGAHAEDGRYVGADVVLQDAEAIRRASLPASHADALVELSCGYTCNLDMRPGVSPDGERYDAVQREIVINHVALGPKDWGRAGNEVKLKLDGGAVCVVDEAALVALDRGARNRSALARDPELALFAFRLLARR